MQNWSEAHDQYRSLFLMKSFIGTKTALEKDWP